MPKRMNSTKRRLNVVRSRKSIRSKCIKWEVPLYFIILSSIILETSNPLSQPCLSSLSLFSHLLLTQRYEAKYNRIDLCRRFGWQIFISSQASSASSMSTRSKPAMPSPWSRSTLPSMYLFSSFQSSQNDKWRWLSFLQCFFKRTMMMWLLKIELVCSGCCLSLLAGY